MNYWMDQHEMLNRRLLSFEGHFFPLRRPLIFKKKKNCSGQPESWVTVLLSQPMFLL